MTAGSSACEDMRFRFEEKRKEGRDASAPFPVATRQTSCGEQNLIGACPCHGDNTGRHWTAGSASSVGWRSPHSDQVITYNATRAIFVRGGMRPISTSGVFSEKLPGETARYPASDHANCPPFAAWLSVARVCAPSAVTSARPLAERTAMTSPLGDQTTPSAVP